MKFLYFGDKHERVTSPENRLDNFKETQKIKTKEILELGKKYGVSAFLQPGDFFDTPNPPLDFVSEVMEQWTGQNIHEIFAKFVAGELREADVMDIIKSYIPLIGVAGNHELYGNNIKTLSKTAIGFINRMGLMRFATKDNPYFFHTDDGLKIAITGTHYHLDIDSPEHLDDYIVDEKLGDYHIHIVHGMLSDKDMGKYVRHTLVEQIKHTKADLTISGHDHIGFPITEIDGKYFVNPGAIPRMSNDVKEMKRKPKVLLIDITKDNGLQLKEIYLKSAQKGDTVLNRTKIIERKKKEQRLEEFKKAVRDAGMKKATDITEIIRDLADTKDVSLEIKDDLLGRISEKKREMNAEPTAIVEEAYIERMVIENFQSHEYTDIPFSNGFNIFVGESKQGKTAVLRAFQWVYENKPAGKRIVRIGADFARVTIYLSNGYIISRYMEAKKSGKNGYEITDPNTGEVEYHNTKILPEVQKLLGFTNLMIDKDLQFNLNFMKQGTGWFLIGDNFTAPSKAKIIGGIYGTQYADAVVREIDSEERKINDQVKKSHQELQKLDERIEEYDYLKDLGESIQQVENLLKEIDDLERRKQQIHQLLDKRVEIQRQIAENDMIINRLTILNDVERIAKETKEKNKHREQLQKHVVKHQEVSTKLHHIQLSLEAVKYLDEAKEEFLSIKELAEKSIKIQYQANKYRQVQEKVLQEDEVLAKTNELETISQLLKSVQQGVQKRKELADIAIRAKKAETKAMEQKSKLKAIEETLNETKQLDEGKNMYIRLKTWIDQKTQIELKIGQYKKQVNAIEKEERIINAQSREMESLIEQYQEKLEEAGKCPVCYGTIDKTTINRIVSEYQLVEGEF